MSGHAQQVALAMARPSARRETLVQDISGRGVMLPECGSLPVPRYLAARARFACGYCQRLVDDWEQVESFAFARDGVVCQLLRRF